MKHLKILFLAFLLTACAKDDKNLIAENQLANINNKTNFDDIKDLFENDSVAYTIERDGLGQSLKAKSRIIKVYDTSGQNILIIKPFEISDSVSLVKNIRVLTDRFKTSNGIGLGSAFSELKKYHDVSDIQSSLKSVIINLEDINALVSFDREVLPGDVRFDMDTDIKPTMIPDDAEINRFWLNFETEENND